MTLSPRGTHLAQIPSSHGPLHPYRPTSNPTGPIHLLYAENRLMHAHIARFLAAHPPTDAALLSYGEGYAGTHRLRSAMAGHLNEYFGPAGRALGLDAEQLAFAAGVTGLSEGVVMVLCEMGEGVLLGKWNYGAFPTDLGARTGVEVVGVWFGGDEFGAGEEVGVDQFEDVDGCVQAYERAFVRAEERGVRCRVVVLCNPNNPLGRCYTRELLVGLVRWAAERGVHVVSDEIYGLSVYERKGRVSEVFTSVLALSEEEVPGDWLREGVHVLYGLSKDYAAGGLRLGCVVSRNKSFMAAIRGGVCRFSSPSSLSMDVAASMLEDRVWMRDFLQRSCQAILEQRLLTEKLLDDTGITYYRQGNAGLYMWLNLAPFLRTADFDGNGWAAEKQLAKRLNDAGVLLSSGERYQSEKPGRFRMIFTYDETTLREGIRRVGKVLRTSEKSS